MLKEIEVAKKNINVEIQGNIILQGAYLKDDNYQQAANLKQENKGLEKAWLILDAATGGHKP